MQSFASCLWFQYLTPWQQQLAQTSEALINHFSQNKVYVADYSFLVFPMAKAYEGFLKKLLFDWQLINQAVYEGNRFRIGRALNPDVSRDQRDQYWLYDDVVRLTNDEIAHQLWQAWLKGRNRVFHFFPKDASSLSFKQAVGKVELLSLAMTGAAHFYPKNIPADHDQLPQNH